MISSSSSIPREEQNAIQHLRNNFKPEMTSPGGQLNASDLETIEKVIHSAFIALQDHPEHLGAKIVDCVIPVTHHVQLIVSSEPGMFRLIGLFGDQIGMGGEGRITHVVNLMTGDFEDGDEGVAKILHPKLLEQQMQREETLLQKLNPEGKLIGIAKPLKHFTLKIPQEKHVLVGPYYQDKDLFTDYEVARNRSPEDKLWIVYQITHGLSEMHKRKMTHGDLKEENIFIGKNASAYIGDFGGCLDHADENIFDRNDVFTPSYCVRTDLVLAKHARKRHDKRLLEVIKEKGDIFAVSLLIARYLLDGADIFPVDPEEAEAKHIFAYDKGNDLEATYEEFSEPLKSCNLSDETIALLWSGLCSQYIYRPTIDKIRASLEEDLKAHAPKRYAQLKAEKITE